MPKVNYIFAVGRRKRAIARIRLFRKPGDILVNDLPIAKYFPGEISKTFYLEPFRTCNVIDKYHATIKVFGSGKSGQLGAVIHGLARVLVKADEAKFRPILKKKGFLTRDPRKKERRKVGTGGKARRKKQSPKR
jgi:small subunit ribosomal protein S9